MSSAVVTFKSPQPPKAADYGGGNSAAAALGDAAKDELKEKQKLGHRRIDRQGEVSYKRVPTNDLMGAIQLGIANSIGSLASKPERQLLVQDFDYIENVAFPNEGSLTTPSHQFRDFRFKTYAPMAFRHFRDLFNIKPADFLRSICTEPLKELSNPGASGSIFYVSSDDQFIIKTVQKKESEFFQRLLSGYYMNIHQNPKTLLPKFFGFFCYQSFGKNIRLLVMNNLFPQSIPIHEKYDLKGSTYKRMASKTERDKNCPTLKDLDFLKDHKDGILLDPATYDALVKVLGRDTLVLRCFRIMDYSLLLGVHNMDLANEAGTGNTTEEEGIEQPGTSRAVDVRHKRSQRLKSKFSMWGSLQGDDGFSNNPADGIPARNSKGERLLLFIGIIDILQSYRISKKIEHIWKSVLHDGDTVSVHHPDFYAERFQNFMQLHLFKKAPVDTTQTKHHGKFRSFVHSYLALKHSPSRKRTTRRSVSDKDDDVDIQARSSARRNYRADLEKKTSRPDKKESRRLFANVDPKGTTGDNPSDTDHDNEVLTNETTPLDPNSLRPHYDSTCDNVLRLENVEISIEEPSSSRRD